MGEDESQDTEATEGTRPRATVAERATPKPAEAAMSGAPIEEGTPLSAERVEVRRRTVGRVEAENLTVTQGAVGAARVERLQLDRGAIGAAMAGEVELSRGYARSILARHVQLDRAAARVIIAADVRADQSAAMFLIARRVDGNVKVLFDWRGALAFGAAAGLLLGLLSRLRRRRS
jgi:hypothetical protein